VVDVLRARSRPTGRNQRQPRCGWREAVHETATRARAHPAPHVQDGLGGGTCTDVAVSWTICSPAERQSNG
jgi:hypothetical protein